MSKGQGLCLHCVNLNEDLLEVAWAEGIVGNCFLSAEEFFILQTEKYVFEK